jgi:LacI family transcriptional regulator
VNTGVYEPGGPHPSIGPDNRAVAAAAVEHLLALGHRRFAVISGKVALNDRAALQIEGIRERLAGEGINLPGHMVIDCGFALAEARQVFRRLVSFQDPPTAVICTSDQLAFGCILEAANAGVAIPGDVSIMGFDDFQWSANLTPALTTMFVPTAEIGMAAADFLIDRMEGASEAKARELTARLIVRESTGRPKSA